MKKRIILTIVFGLMTFMAFSVLAEEINIVGTGSGMTILKNIAEAFGVTNPVVKVEVPESIGSGGGIKSVGSDQAVIGRVARKIKENEKLYGLTYHPIAKMPIVFFVNKSAGVDNLTPQQICGIYAGKITNWAEVGGNKAKIRVIRREDGDSSLKVLRSTLPGFKSLVITQKSKTTLTDQETCRITAKKDNTIAFGAFGDARNVDVTILSIAGKQPTDKDYPYTGELALIFKEKNNRGEIKQFLSFITGPEARAAIKAGGGMPIH